MEGIPRAASVMGQCGLLNENSSRKQFQSDSQIDWIACPILHYSSDVPSALLIRRKIAPPMDQAHEAGLTVICWN